MVSRQDAKRTRSPAPAWFEALIAPPVERRELPVVANGQRIGSVLITGVADDEIAEAWENFVALTAGGVGLNVAMIVILFLLFGRVLAPLTNLARGLRDLEGRNYRVRLARPDARELGAIADRFNSLAQALDMLRAENNELNRRLITAQDDERRHTALELHDEVGPCLFGLKANAASIATLADERPGAPAGLAERARDMLAIIDHLQTINRSLLNRLRPMALGHVPLGDLLAEVVRERARQHPGSADRLHARRVAAELWRADRPDDLSLRAGKPHQHDPPCAGDAASTSRSARSTGTARRAAPEPANPGRRARHRSGRADRTRLARHAGTRAGPGRKLCRRRRVRPAARACTSPSRSARRHADAGAA